MVEVGVAIGVREVCGAGQKSGRRPLYAAVITNDEFLVEDPGQAAQDWSASTWLHEAGVKLFLPNRAAPFRKLHHKLMVIDNAVVVAGSFNYTAPANEYNDENVFVLGSPYADLPEREGGPVDLLRCSELTTFFRTEIDRISNAGTAFAPN